MSSPTANAARQAADDDADANQQNVLEALAETYWKAAHRDICTMILFFCDVLDQGRKIENFLAMDLPEAECENFGKIFEVWLGGQRRGWEGFDIQPLYDETIQRAKERICASDIHDSLPLKRKLRTLSRRLLQSSNFLDMSVFYEPALSVLPSFGQSSPLLEKIKLQATDTTLKCTVIRGMRCVACNSLIRTETYMKCEQGCKQHESNPSPIRVIDDRGSQIKQTIPQDLLGDPPVRVCLVCDLENVCIKPCSREHLRRFSSGDNMSAEEQQVAKAKKKARTDKDGLLTRTVKDILLPYRAEQIFQRKLSDDEDKEFMRNRDLNSATKKFTYALHAGTRLEHALETGASMTALQMPLMFSGGAMPGVGGIASPASGLGGLQATVKSLRNRITPAGAYHTSLHFGSITLESGVGRLRVAGQSFETKRGVLVSPRFSPALLAHGKDATVLLYEPVERLETGDDNNILPLGTCCSIFATQDEHGQYKRKRVKLVKRPIEERSGLACMKIVYGAAFSGYPESRQAAENATIELLVQEALSYHKFSGRSKTVRAHQQALFQGAERILQSLKSAIGNEVGKYLKRLADVLVSPDINLSHNALFNNCQRLVDKLLKGKDFEYFFPRLPKQTKSCDGPVTELAWPQYLMSFSDRIDGQYLSLQQPNSFMATYFSQTRFGGDLADFMMKPDDAARRYDALLLLRGSMKTVNHRTAAFSTMWEMPRDTLSILQFQLSRERLRYVSTTGDMTSQGEWLENRLQLLMLGDVFGSYSGALGTSLFNLAVCDPSLINKIVLPKARVMGSVRVGERVRILKLPARQTVYFIASKAEKQLDEVFQAPDQDLALFSSVLNQCFRQFMRSYAINVSRTVSKILQKFARSSRAKRGFATVSRLYGTDVLSYAIHQAFQLYEARKRDGWFHLDFGDFIVVVQLFRKSKTIREGTAVIPPNVNADG